MRAISTRKKPTSGSKQTLDVLWGVRAIAEVANITERQAGQLLQQGKLPGKKKGKHWISTVSALRKDLSV